MKRLFLITIIVMAVVLVGALHGSNVPEERAGDSAGEQVYPGNFPEKLPGIIFDAAVLAPIIR
jgi:Na+-transporting methylmalonyl-CoA/oxaloacetate decarboxylase gamma subunit